MAFISTVLKEVWNLSLSRYFYVLHRIPPLKEGGEWDRRQFPGLDCVYTQRWLHYLANKRKREEEEGGRRTIPEKKERKDVGEGGGGRERKKAGGHSRKLDDCMGLLELMSPVVSFL